ncbi:MAG: amphi-Trp domain-containing protein [Haloarculaceae archaeon]
MPDEVLFESERVMNASAVGSYLRTVAEKLESGDSITLAAGSEEYTVSPPSSVEFEVKAEREGPASGPGELSVEFELEWDEGAGNGDGDLSIS